MIRSVAILGAGTMGSQLAGIMANNRLSVLLLDIPNKEEDKNLYSKRGIEKLLKSKIPTFYAPEFQNFIQPGNFEDDLNKLEKVDWVIEAVIENFEIKRELLEKIQKFVKKDAIVSTNTSGISINKLCENLSFEKNFIGTHFFNPPRYMKLLEIIPGKRTLPQVVDSVVKFARNTLGKGIVYAKDTPNFIANRIGIFGILETFRLMEELGLSIEEVDALTGRVMGRPRSATFRTLDLIGLDVLLNVINNVYTGVSENEKSLFEAPDFLKKMVKKNILGDKTKGGFYKKENGKRLVINPRDFKYQEYKRVSFPSVERAKQEETPEGKLKTLISMKDKGSLFVKNLVLNTLHYAASKIPEIADDILNVDNAMKWGFNWELGPFEIWDAIGVPDVVERLQKEDKQVPLLVSELLSRGEDKFYKSKDGSTFYFDLQEKSHLEVPFPPKFLLIKSFKEKKKTIIENPEASLIDIEDGVLCFEFHTKANAIGPGILNSLNRSLDLLEKDYEGMVIGNQGQHFSAGANLGLILFAIQEEDFDEIEMAIKTFQDVHMRIKYFPKPIVTAPFGRTLGGGCEMCLHSSANQASAELYMGLVEVAVGLIPAAGGCKEMIMRGFSEIEKNENPNYYAVVRRLLETVGMAKFSMSAYEAMKLGFLSSKDSITSNTDFLIQDAKDRVLNMVETGYQVPVKRKVKALGKNGIGYARALIYNLKEGNFITEHDAFIANKLAYVLCGGERIEGEEVVEEDLLDLEREVFLELCGTQKTLERIQHMLEKRKPLRN